MNGLLGLLIEIAIIAIVAYNWQLLLLRRSPPSSRLGQGKTGADLDQHPTESVQGSGTSVAAKRGVLGEPPSSSPPSLTDRIRAADRTFEEAAFLAGASQAYELILDAYAKGDIDHLRQLLDAEVASAFRRGIAERREQGVETEFRFIGMKAAQIVAVWVEKKMAEITVRFVSEVVTANRSANGVILQGDPRNIVEMEDLWTFGRSLCSTDPNWRLMATEGAESFASGSGR